MHVSLKVEERRGNRHLETHGTPRAGARRHQPAGWRPEGRSGDIFVVFQPHGFINDFDGLEVASTPGSPRRYDTFVPIIFAGAGIAPQRVFREIQIIDVVPPLAAGAGTKPLSGARGKVLAEVLEDR